MAYRRAVIPATIALVCAAVVFREGDAHACDPGPRYGVEIPFDDTPECLVVQNLGSDDRASLGFQNNCKKPAHVAVVKCAACGEDVDVAPRDRGIVAIETRKIDHGISEGVATKQTLEWSMDGEKGTVKSTVTWRNTWAECGEKKSAVRTVKRWFDCATSPRSVRGGWALALVVLAAFAWRRHDRISARTSAPPCRRSASTPSPKPTGASASSPT